MNDDWPFDDPKNVATFTVHQIARDRNPILRVTHDSEDGAWQFLEWSGHYARRIDLPKSQQLAT